MYLLYSLIISLVFIGLLPYFAFQAVRHGKYAPSFRQRLGLLPRSVRGNGERTLWLHAVSVGEFIVARTLIDRVRAEFPDLRLVISTTTDTGQALARAQADKVAGTFYFPFDWAFAVRRALKWVNPAIVVILETELWPNFLRECHRRGVVTVLANGRISERSFRRYRRVNSLISRTLNDFSLLLMQTDSDASRARELGAASQKVRVCGNLKYDQPLTMREDSPAAANIQLTKLREFLKLSDSQHIVVAGSTAPGEEEILLDCLQRIRKLHGLEETRMIIAPRHPERFDEVAGLISRAGFRCVRRSRQDDGAARPDVILLDTIGELAPVYEFADVVFVGGSLVARGGHNIIEPAAFGKAIVVGKHTENFRQIVSDFREADAVVQLDSIGEEAAHELTREIAGLLADRERAHILGLNARNLLLARRGASDCTIAAIRELIAG